MGIAWQMLDYIMNLNFEKLFKTSLATKLQNFFSHIPTIKALMAADLYMQIRQT